MLGYIKGRGKGKVCLAKLLVLCRMELSTKNTRLESILMSLSQAPAITGITTYASYLKTSPVCPGTR